MNADGGTVTANSESSQLWKRRGEAPIAPPRNPAPQRRELADGRINRAPWLDSAMTEAGEDTSAMLGTGVCVKVDAVDWFVREVLPLESVLERFIRRNSRDLDEVPDLRQEVYARVFSACVDFRPLSAQAFVLSTARNLLIDRARRSQIASFESFAEMDVFPQLVDDLGPDRRAEARSALRKLEDVLQKLPERSRTAVEMRKIEGLSQREVANRMGITEDTVQRHVSIGVRSLANAMAAAGYPADSL